MYESIDAVELFIGIVDALKEKVIHPGSPLEEIALKASKDNFAYIDNRRDAKAKYGYDFWEDLKKQFKEEFIDWMKNQGIVKRLLYSKSEQFPDLLFKARRHEDKLICGNLFELKDSKAGNIASFNSTLPTKYKSLDEISIINGGNLVSRIASAMDREFASDENYHTFQRRSFYFVRTHKNDEGRVRISIVDGSFFETVPKDHLIYQMFLNILRVHLDKKNIQISPETLEQIEKSLSYITDQTIIASSQSIEGASVRPRLRIMAEVHPEGNPHSSFYPEILERSFNLIIQKSIYEQELAKVIRQKIPEIKIFTIRHKRNGEHLVFQFEF